MRIPLTEQKKKPQARLRRRGRRGPTSKFDEAIAIRKPAVRRRVRAEAGAPPRRRERAPAVQEAAPPLAAAGSAWPQVRRLVAARWWVLLILLLLCVGTAYAVSDEQFFVYEAQITGAKHLDAQAIYQAAGVDKQSIFWIDPQQVADKVARLQGIKAVYVRCDLPSAVTIRVEERQPVILWRSDSQHRDWWLDAEGVVLPYHGDPNAPGMVFVVDYSGRQLTAGSRIEPAGLAQSVLQMAASLSGVRVFFYGADRGLYFTQQSENGEWPVYVGDSADLARKIQVTELLNRYFQTGGIRPAYVDVRWAGRPVYGLPGGGSVSSGN